MIPHMLRFFNIASMMLMISVFFENFKKSIYIYGTSESRKYEKTFSRRELLSICSKLNESKDFDHITKLNLRDQFLKSLPEQVMLCKNLNDLILDSNDLQIVPYGLKNLTSLSMSYTNISKIESEICEFTKLINLDISRNRIKTLPTSFTLLKNLKILDISSSNFEILPKLPLNLESLDICDSWLKTLPDHFCDLINLKKLSLYDNKLTKLPESFDKLQSLEELNLHKNCFEIIPEQIYKLKKLKCLNLSDIKIQTVDNQIESLKDLIELKINDCLIEDLPEEICELNSLKILEINCNQILNLPDNIGNLKKLRFLFCNSNKIQRLPKSIGKLEKLTFLQCSDNNLLKVHPNLGDLKSILIISMDNNKISKLPETINNLLSLENLNLANNKLKEFPDNCETLVNLTSLKLSKNFLTEFSTICKIKNLTSLDLSSNKIGKIPVSISNLQELKYLDLSNNQLSDLPKELLKCTKLRYLYLSNNNIKNIPVEFVDLLRNLIKLDLRQNKMDVFGDQTKLGKSEIFIEMENKFYYDNLETEDIYNFLKLKSISFNINNLKMCRIPSLPSKFKEAKDLKAMLQNLILYNSKNSKSSNEQENGSNVCGTINKDILEMSDAKGLLDFIDDFYNSQKFKPNNEEQKNVSDFFKQVLSGLVYRLVLLKDRAQVKHYLKRFSKLPNYVDRYLAAEWVYLYELLVTEEVQDLYYLLKNDKDFKYEEIDQNLESFIKNTIIRFIGVEKMKIVFKLFYDIKHSETYLAFGYWKKNIAEYIGIDVYGGKSSYTDTELLYGCSKLGAIAFFKEFTPPYLISELFQSINKDSLFLSIIFKYLKNLDIKDKNKFLRFNDIDVPVEVKREFCEYILEKMDIIIFK